MADKPTGILRRCDDWPEYDDYVRILGGAVVPVVSYGWMLAQCDRGEREFYLIDLDRLTPDQRDRLIAHLSMRFETSEQEVQSELAKYGGVPILSTHISVAIPMRYFT
jgi:hypothetical protein